MPLLTDAVVRNAKLPPAGHEGQTTQTDLWDAGVPGFGLRVSSTGKKSWVVGVRLLRAGRKVFTRLVLGSYPGMSLSEAREKAREAKVLVSENKDPREIREREKALRLEESRTTFAAVAQDFFKKYVERKGLRPTTARDYRLILTGEDVKPWERRSLGCITKADVLQVLDRILARGSPTQANHFLAYMRKFFRWCVERSIIEAAPTDRLTLPAPLVRRDRALAPDEIREVWKAIETVEKSSAIFSSIFKLLLLTGQRREEVAGMRWDELRDLTTPNALWEIPGERTKNHRPHLVPLSSQALAVISAMPRIVASPFVFTTTGVTHVSGFGRAKQHLDQAIAAQRVKAGHATPIPAFVLHDLRRTVSTRMHEDLGIAPHIVEAVLNHISGYRAGVAGTYNRALYMDERRRALDAWADYLAKLVAPSEKAADRPGKGAANSSRSEVMMQDACQSE